MPNVQTVTHLALNRIGNRTEDYGEFTESGSAGSLVIGEAVTRLYWIESIYMEPMANGTVGSQVAKNFQLWKNTILENPGGTPGTFRYENAIGGIKYKYRAVGW